MEYGLRLCDTYATEIGDYVLILILLEYGLRRHDVIVHRKGATLARKGTTGIIPGSQGTASYIVEGLGNPDSFCSCSHGAGRLMSRTAAIHNLNLNEEVARLESLGIVHAIRCQDDMQEASGAYKDIETVIHNEADLVKVKTRLLPVAVIKG